MDLLKKLPDDQLGQILSLLCELNAYGCGAPPSTLSPFHADYDPHLHRFRTKMGGFSMTARDAAAQKNTQNGVNFVNLQSQLHNLFDFNQVKDKWNSKDEFEYFIVHNIFKHYINPSASRRRRSVPPNNTRDATHGNNNGVYKCTKKHLDDLLCKCVVQSTPDPQSYVPNDKMHRSHESRDTFAQLFTVCIHIWNHIFKKLNSCKTEQQMHFYLRDLNCVPGIDRLRTSILYFKDSDRTAELVDELANDRFGRAHGLATYIETTNATKSLIHAKECLRLVKTIKNSH